MTIEEMLEQEVISQEAYDMLKAMQPPPEKPPEDPKPREEPEETPDYFLEYVNSLNSEKE